MDPLTHILFSSALSRAEIIPHTREAQFIIVLAGVAPDIDMLYRFKSLAKYFIHHRKESHSLPGLFILSLPLLLIGKFFLHGLNFSQLYAGVWLGLLSHIFLDFLTVYGVPFFFPFRQKFFNFGILFFLDPWLDILLLPAILDRFIQLPPAFPARISLFAVCIYLLFLSVMKILALTRGRKFFLEKSPETAQSHLYASPFPLNPFNWLLLRKSQNKIYRMRLSLIFGPGPISIFVSVPAEKLSPFLEKSPLFKALYGFSEFLFFKLSEQDSGTKISGWDLRMSNYGLAFHARAKFNQNAELVSEKFRYY